MFHCEVIDNSKEKITIDKAQKFIESQKCGASLYFLGTVRDHNNDKAVTGITYDAHDAMVKKSFKELNVIDKSPKKIKLKENKIDNVETFSDQKSLKNEQKDYFNSLLNKRELLLKLLINELILL